MSGSDQAMCSRGRPGLRSITCHLLAHGKASGQLGHGTNWPMKELGLGAEPVGYLWAHQFVSTSLYENQGW